MNFLAPFRDQAVCRALAQEIRQASSRPIAIMEVCGGHTMALHRCGIPSMLPPHVKLVSGPGCPVCVTEIGYVDHAIALSRLPRVTLTTFGDLIRVPGSTCSLERRRAEGADVRVVGSPLDALALARQEPDRTVVFLGIGFETTAPGTAASILRAEQHGVTNFLVLSGHKVMPPAMTALIDDGVKIDAYLCPGHVSVVTGSGIYRPIVENYRKPCVISGFEPADILMSILMIVRQFERGCPSVEIQYTRAVRQSGNARAQAAMAEVFEPADRRWRGLGRIPASGLAIKPRYAARDAARVLAAEPEPPREPVGCRCGEILKGLAAPGECPLFGAPCTPEHPVGACMVSSEGACAAWYAYAA